MNAPTRSLPAGQARRAKATGPRPDLLWLLWTLPGLELSCGFLQPLVGLWALVPAGLFVVALVAVVAWPTGGDS